MARDFWHFPTQVELHHGVSPEEPQYNGALVGHYQNVHHLMEDLRISHSMIVHEVWCKDEGYFQQPGKKFFWVCLNTNLKCSSKFCCAKNGNSGVGARLVICSIQLDSIVLIQIISNVQQVKQLLILITHS